MKLLEHEAKKIFSSRGIPTPKGVTFTKPEQLSAALVKKVSSYPVVVKAQVYAGGRGKGGGVVLAKSFAEVRATTKRLLGNQLVTPQTGAEGVPVKTLLIEEGLTIQKEYYLSVLIDRSLQAPVVVASAEGGMSIEEIAEKNPKAILKTAFDPLLGLLSYQARDIVSWLGIPKENQRQAANQLQILTKLFFELDASLLEINPWALTKEHGMLALDAKMTIDDNAFFRHPQFEKKKTADADSPAEAKSRKIGINYVGLDGDIGCMVNGAGLAMATMDAIKLHGGEPANFLDVGGGADANQVTQAFKLILSDKGVRAVLVNIFGGIVKCDVIAEGIITAAKSIKLNVPLVVRLEGTNVDKGKELLEKSGLGFLTASSMDEAAQKAVQAVEQN